MVDDALRIAGRARSVIERDRLPLVLRRHFREGRVAGREKRLVIHLAEPFAAGSHRIDDVDDDGLLFELRQGLPDHRRKFGVGDQHLSLAVLEDEGDGPRVEADVERVQHRPGHRHSEMRLECLGDVGRHQRDRVAAPDPARRKRRRQPAAAFERLAPAVPPLPMYDREPVRIHRRAAHQKPDRGQRHVIGRVLVETDLIGVGHRRYPPRRDRNLKGPLTPTLSPRAGEGGTRDAGG